MDNLGRSIVDIIAGGGGTQYLSELKDVSIRNGVVDGEVLYFNGNKWADGLPGFGTGGGIKTLTSSDTQSPTQPFALVISNNAGTATLSSFSFIRVGNVVTATMAGQCDMPAPVSAATVTITNASLKSFAKIDPNLPGTGYYASGSASVSPVITQLGGSTFPLVYPKIFIDASGNLLLQLYCAGASWAGASNIISGTYDFFWTVSYTSTYNK